MTAHHDSDVTVTVGSDDSVTVTVGTDCDHPVTVTVTTASGTETVTVDPRAASARRAAHSADVGTTTPETAEAAAAPASDGPASDEQAAAAPASDGPASDGPASDGPASDGPASHAPASDDPASDDPASEPAPPVHAVDVSTPQDHPRDLDELFAELHREQPPAEALITPAAPAGPGTSAGPAAPGASTAASVTEASSAPATTASLVLDPVAVANDDKPASTGQSRLFGRGLLYVVVWSLQLVTSTVVSPVLAHLLGPGQFGSLASAIALYQVLSVVALIGLDQALVLQRAEDGDAKASRGLVAVGMVIALLVSIVAAVTTPLWSGLLGFGDDQTIVVLVILWTGPSAAVSVMLALLLAEDRFRSFAIVSALSAVGGQLVGLALLIFVHRDATTYAWGGVVSQFAAMFVGVAITRPRLRGLIDWSVTRRAMKLGLPLAVSSLAYFVLNAGDRIVLQRMEGADAVGQYQVAYVVGSAVILMLSFTNGAWAAQFAQMRHVGERVALALRSRDELYRMLIPIVIAVTLASPLALPILAPASFPS